MFWGYSQLSAHHPESSLEHGSVEGPYVIGDNMQSMTTSLLFPPVFLWADKFEKWCWWILRELSFGRWSKPTSYTLCSITTLCVLMTCWDYLCYMMIMVRHWIQNQFCSFFFLPVIIRLEPRLGKENETDLQSSVLSFSYNSSWSIMSLCPFQRWNARRAALWAEMALISMALAAHSMLLR